MSRLRATFAELLGLKAVTGRDLTGNEARPPATAPSRTQMPGRYDSLDQFNGGAHMYADTSGDFDGSDDDDGADEAVPSDVEDAAFLNSQLDPTAECPSTLDPNRFVHQSRKK